MSAGHSERSTHPTPTSELERRWGLVRDGMRDAAVDALLVHSHVDGLGGATRWFADLPAGEGYPVSIVFPVDAPMTVVMHGPLGGDRAVAPDDPVLRGVARVLTTASFTSAPYCDDYDADLVLDVLAELRPQRLGVVAPAQFPYTLLDRVHSALTHVEMTGAAELVDLAKAVKSPVEQTAIHAAAALQDGALAHMLAVAEPGLRESDIAAAGQHYCQERGSEGGIFLLGSAPAGEAPTLATRHFQNRVVRRGDQLVVLVENSGPGGHYTHLGRMAVFGRPTEAMRRAHELAVSAQRRVAELLRPEADPAAVSAEYDELMRAHGLPAENRLVAHGQGYDVVERPLIRSDETMLLAAGMNIGVHPMFTLDGALGFVCDNYLVGADGAERVHSFPPGLVEL